MKLKTLLKPLLGASIVAACGAAQAQAFDAVRLYGDPGGSGQGSVGAAVVSGYRYMGSDERRTALFPLVRPAWARSWRWKSSRELTTVSEVKCNCARATERGEEARSETASRGTRSA